MVLLAVSSVTTVVPSNNRGGSAPGAARILSPLLFQCGQYCARFKLEAVNFALIQLNSLVNTLEFGYDVVYRGLVFRIGPRLSVCKRCVSHGFLALIRSFVEQFSIGYGPSYSRVYVALRLLPDGLLVKLVYRKPPTWYGWLHFRGVATPVNCGRFRFRGAVH